MISTGLCKIEEIFLTNVVLPVPGGPCNPIILPIVLGLVIYCPIV